MTRPCSSQAKELTLTSSCQTPPPPNDMVCSTMPKHRHIHKYTTYNFICLSAMNLKYLLCISWIVCALIHYDIQKCTQFKKKNAYVLYHKVMHDWVSKPKMCIQYLSVHTYFKVKTVLGASLTSKSQEYRNGQP